MENNRAPTLRGYVLDRFCTVSEFAAAIGWSCRKARETISGKRELSKAEMEILIRFLEIPAAAIAPVFFGGLWV